MAEHSRWSNSYVTHEKIFMLSGWGLALFAALLLGTLTIPPSHAGEAKVYAKGEMTTFVPRRSRDVIADLKFADKTGAERSISEWRGRVVLLNLWATWCAPCRKEMPSLDRLQSRMGGEEFEVVAVSVDRKGPEVSGAFLEETDARNLALYIDRSGKIARDIKGFGLPITVLIGREGEEIGRLIGPAEWDSEDAVALIEAAIDGKLDPEK